MAAQTTTPAFPSPPMTHLPTPSATSPPPPTGSTLLLLQPMAVEPATKQRATKQPRATARRKCWYAAKKNERSELGEQIRKLVEQKELLQLPAATRERALLKQQQENALMRQAAREHWQGPLARAQSALSSGVRTQGTPLARFIHLSAGADDRARTFRELKSSMAHDAERYILERTRFMDPTAEAAQWNEFTLPNGDYCFHCLDVIPLPMYSSVRQVFERMRDFFFNMEIAWTEKSEEIMLRQGEFETTEQEVATQRFLTLTPSGVLVESNTLHVSLLRSNFDGVREDGSVGDLVVMAIDTVDVDELYPYVPTERVRQDITGAMVVRAFPRQAGGSGEDAGDLIVITQVYFAQMHRSELAVNPDWKNGAIFGRDFCSRTMLGLD